MKGSKINNKVFFFFFRETKENLSLTQVEENE